MILTPFPHLAHAAVKFPLLSLLLLFVSKVMQVSCEMLGEVFYRHVLWKWEMRVTVEAHYYEAQVNAGLAQDCSNSIINALHC